MHKTGFELINYENEISIVDYFNLVNKLMLGKWSGKRLCKKGLDLISGQSYHHFNHIFVKVRYLKY